MAARKTRTAAQEAEKCAELLQLLVRLKAADENGFCKCVTCDTVKHYKELQGGHFIPRGKSATKLLVENVHPQCRQCNAFGMKGGMAAQLYTIYMQEMYGHEFVDELISQARTVKKWVRAEVEEIAEDFKAQIKEHEKRVCGIN
jgi:hypothetical protein